MYIEYRVSKPVIIIIRIFNKNSRIGFFFEILSTYQLDETKH